MDDWAEVWVFDPMLDQDLNSPVLVQNAEGTLEPEEWARTHGVANYPNSIYFFATLTVED